ncbi:MAG TPA: cytochrome c3 family protein [Bryobacteraceae bacterium]|nr:cytochrome c3 family protein [Bryobacteraceae bacterium]
MSQLFRPGANTFAKASVIAGLGIALGLGGIVNNIERTSYVTNVNVPRDQPVMFTHKHHVSGVGMDCRYCHTSVEVSSSAGIPPTETCMGCHSQIWSEAPILEPVRESWRSGKSIQWTRVHDLPAFVYFNHSIHVNKGVGCATCHGRVDLMPMVWKENTLLMEWCLDCHRAPEKYIRPKDQVFNMEYKPEGDQAALGAKLVAEYKVRKLTDCSVCHR